MVVFRYLVSTNHRRVLLPHIDKLLEERVLMGTSLASQELVRYVSSIPNQTDSSHGNSAVPTRSAALPTYYTIFVRSSPRHN